MYGEIIKKNSELKSREIDVEGFENLYKAHKAARLGKRDKIEVIDFELNLSRNLTLLSQSLINKTYKMSGYYSFYVHDPKEREIHALHYVDRVVQHCICDELLAPLAMLVMMESIQQKIIENGERGKST